MATEEISDMDTLLEEDVEDVGEVALETEEVVELEEDVAEDGTPIAVATVRRTTTVTATEDPGEGMFMRAVAVLTSIVLLMAVPVVAGITLDSPSSMASSIAGWFTKP
jgi:hypothetical protein